MKNIIVIGVLVAILAAAICYICRAKKKGVRCIGCPNGANCAGKCAECSKDTNP